MTLFVLFSPTSGCFGTVRFARNSTVNECLIRVARNTFATPISVRKGCALSALSQAFRFVLGFAAIAATFIRIAAVEQGKEEETRHAD